MEKKSLVQISLYNELKKSYFVTNYAMRQVLSYVQDHRFSFHYDYNGNTNDAFMYFDVDSAKQVFLFDLYINSLISQKDE